MMNNKAKQMTSFKKENFRKSGIYLLYVLDETHGMYNPHNKYRGEFVARFKYQRGAAGTFQTFLIKNFTVEEYFSRLAAHEAPLAILQSKGYILPHIKKWLKEGGYPVTPEGYKQFNLDQHAISETLANLKKKGYLTAMKAA